MNYYDNLMLEYYRVLNNAWKTEIRDATRLAIQMLSDMPRAEKINKDEYSDSIEPSVRSF